MEQESETPLFQDAQRLRARALFLGQRLDTRSLEQDRRYATAPLMVPAGEAGCAVLLRYGVVVFFGSTPTEEESFLSQVRPGVFEPFERPEREEIDVVRSEHQSERVEQTEIHLHEFTIERLQLVANILSKSVVLAHYETDLARGFDRIEPLAGELQRGGRGTSQGKELLSHIGDTLSIQAKMVGRVEVEEKPELLWEHPELERLYSRLEDEYEIRERHLALGRKLNLISQTAETLLDLLQARRSLRVEWYIVILIVVEILLVVYEMFLAPAH